MTIVFGGQSSSAHAVELGGLLDEALHRQRTTVVVAYPVNLTANYALILDRMGWRPEYGTDGVPQRVEVMDERFRSYFRTYGLARSGYFDVRTARGLGRIETGTARGKATCAIAAPHGRGTLVVLPYHVASFTSSQRAIVEAIFEPVTALTRGAEGTIGPHLESLRLPGENSLLERISATEAELEALQAEARRVERFRLLLGDLHGERLETLVIDALNAILASSGYRAEDRPELFREDFWLLRGDDEVALAEVKGINTGVRRPHVNQVDDHRDALGRSPDDLPGMLVVNQHRGADDLERRREVPHPDVIAHLRRQNVLLLRTADLFALLSRAMAGADAVSPLVDGIAAGGGWLRVTGDGDGTVCELVTG